jgi:hypothetical protein
MTNQFPGATKMVKVPPELFTEWLQKVMEQHGSKAGTVAGVMVDKAAQWAADQELDACCEYLTRCAQWEPEDIEDLRAARRPKPPTLAEQATAELDDAVMRGDCITTTDAMPLLRAALKRLAELENHQ